MNKITGWLTTLACAGLLAACGGGGGSAGTPVNGTGTVTSKAASVILTAGATTIASSGADGTEVTLTAIVRDSGGNALSGETVSFTTSSGTISSTNRTTDTSGQVIEKLSVKGDSSLRTITITAKAGSVTSSAVTVQVVNSVPTLTLTTSSGTLASAGITGNEVTVTALVRDASNNVLPGVTVSMSSNSGSLTVSNATTDSSGIVTGKLGTGSDSTSRAITVSASVSGSAVATTVVNVSGNKLTVNAASSINVGSSTDVTVKLVDSAGNALTGKTVTYSSNANSLSVKDGGSAVTNSAGQLVLSYAASGGSADVITVKSMGEIASTSIAINSSTFALKLLDSSGNVETSANIGGCQQVAVTNAPGSTVTISTSRGTVYSNSSCTTALSSALSVSSGAATAYVNATGPGVATLTATSGGQTTQNNLEFVAPLTSSATISIQADPATIGVNTTTSTSQQSTLRAVVRDGTAENNLVKNAPVSFSILADASGGSLSQPALVNTGTDGSATASFIAGTSATATNGVQIQARIIGGSNATATVNLTVAQKSLFISAGTGNTVGVPTTATYQMDYVVIVTDAAGNAVSGVNLTASVLPSTYYKGYLGYTSPSGPWEPVVRISCSNEDVNNNGILDAGEDTNGNGKLDPGIPVTVTPSVTTDSTGRATVSLVYPRDRVNWLDVNLTIRGQASGTESTYTSLVHLMGLSTDYTTQTVTPPGVNSPYGVATQCSNPL
ncbi:Ig-like group 1 domain-containing protein [Duganella sp. FT80W]|uniref:Ig-like group 1 domain-containing protein n=1 Tax=Duganella guangzhouensis TaxID=2666084 RepID=A0A6I2LBT1_9BURK|nr:Ig-like domain-containing protein [Duganella guangzhouensis]MRW93719.1 Ig-like group 1 domain-containing protein [Duganella guangzhouensis]